MLRSELESARAAAALEATRLSGELARSQLEVTRLSSELVSAQAAFRRVVVWLANCALSCELGPAGNISRTYPIYTLLSFMSPSSFCYADTRLTLGRSVQL